MTTPEDVLAFWFSETAEPLWFEAEPDFDAAVERTLGPLWRQAREGGLTNWQDTPAGALALVIVLDQAPRNMFRVDARAFSTDEQARMVAAKALERGFDRALSPKQRQFLYMPFMHSENLADQETCVTLMRERVGLEDALAFALGHHAIIARFGRFPRRNAALGRESTEAERAFLAAGEAD